MDTDMSHSSFHLYSGNRREMKRSMSSMVYESARGTGIHSIINRDIYTVSHTVDDTMDHSVTERMLRDASSDSGFELTPIQIETIMKVVWRPRSRAVVGYKIQRERSPEVNVFKTFESPSTDMGSPVFLDLPPGTGKTIVSALSCLLLSTERSTEASSLQTVNSSQRGYTEIVPKKPRGGRVSMIFCPKHVHHQWVFAANKAVEIMSIMYPSRVFRLECNKKASTLDSSSVDAAIIVCDSSSCNLTKMMEAEVLYGTLCFDECTENCDVKNNAVYSIIPESLMYGRLVLISADFSKMRDYNSKVGSCRQEAMIRRVFGRCNATELSLAIRGSRYSSGFYSTGFTSVGRAASVVACLTMNAVFPENRREQVVRDSAELLSDVSLYTFGIKYRRSIFERLGSSAAFDLTPSNGVERFKETVGVDISGCESIDEILAVVEANKMTIHNRVNRRAIRALEVLREVVSEDCIVCFDKMEKASIIQPCFHVVCQECLPKLRTSGRCPMCREVIRGAVTSDVVGKRTYEEAFNEEKKNIEDAVEDVEEEDMEEEEDVEDEAKDEAGTMGEEFAKSIEKLIPVNDGSLTMQDTMGNIMKSLSFSHERSGGGTFRVVVICSQVDLNTTGFTSEGYEIIKYRATGTIRSPVTRKRLAKQLSDFQKEDGKKKMMLVHDETSGSGARLGSRSSRDDNITGMDFPRLEAVVSIGSENRSQRIGRLCRMSRLFIETGKRDAVYVELSGI